MEKLYPQKIPNRFNQVQTFLLAVFGGVSDGNGVDIGVPEEYISVSCISIGGDANDCCDNLVLSSGSIFTEISAEILLCCVLFRRAVILIRIMILFWFES